MVHIKSDKNFKETNTKKNFFLFFLFLCVYVSVEIDAMMDGLKTASGIAISMHITIS